MNEQLSLQLNGQTRVFDGLGSPETLAALLAFLGLKPDRVAVELNGEIAARTAWETTAVKTGDRLEIVHFVGGGVV